MINNDIINNEESFFNEKKDFYAQLKTCDLIKRNNMEGDLPYYDEVFNNTYMYLMRHFRKAGGK